MPGIVTADGVFVRQAGRLHKLPRTRQTVTAFVVDLEPCPCGKPNCDRDEWHELMGDVCEVCGGVVCDCITLAAQTAMLARIDADPHSYNDLTKLDIPF